VAIANIRAICERRLAGRYELEVIDVCQQPELAVQEQLVALPMLVKASPLPVRHLVGDLSDEARVLAALALKP
jgi:circadian clock protein KaiB